MKLYHVFFVLRFWIFGSPNEFVCLNLVAKNVVFFKYCIENAFVKAVRYTKNRLISTWLSHRLAMQTQGRGLAEGKRFLIAGKVTHFRQFKRSLMSGFGEFA